LIKKAIRPLEPTTHASGRPARSTAPTGPSVPEPQAKKVLGRSKKDQNQANEPHSKIYAKKTQKKVTPRKKASNLIKRLQLMKISNPNLVTSSVRKGSDHPGQVVVQEEEATTLCEIPSSVKPEPDC
jgi:hypothetical protein